MEKRNFSRTSPPPSYDQQPRGHSNGPDGKSPGVLRLKPAKSPDNAYIYRNLVAVSPNDIRPREDQQDIYVIVNGQFVFSARPLQGFPPGHISLSDPQRTWAQIALTDTVDVQLYNPIQNGRSPFLASLDVSVGFAGRKTTDTPYDQDDLSQHVISNFANQILAPGQQFIMDHKSIALRLIVKSVQLGDMAMSKAEPSPPDSHPNSRGMLTRQTVMNFFKDPRSPINIKASTNRPAANAILQSDFKFEDMGIGGLDNEFSTIFRRAFASRIFPPALIEQMGMQHCKGILLYGPPGTGKTLIARQIGKMLNAREPKVINGPEVLNKYVGQSEENIRKLFADAEKEYKEKGDESGLHIIIFDELDAVCRQRGSGSAGGTGVGDSVVNQLLSKLDGVDQLNNILLIGMTNRKDMIDDALLRPGRLELHVEISLPDEPGRVQIFKIHTESMRKNNRLSNDVNIDELAAMSKNFSGAEISGLVRAAQSHAFSRHLKVGSMASVKEDVNKIQLHRNDFLLALDEVEPAYGASEESLKHCLELGMYEYSQNIRSILEQGKSLSEQVQHSRHRLLSALFYGPPSSGKTALAAQVAINSNYPFIRRISPSDMKGFNEAAKIQHIHGVFNDAHKSSLSLVLIDSIEKIIDWSPIGPRFSNSIVVALSVAIADAMPPKGRRLLVLATTSRMEALRQLQLDEAFTHEIAVPSVQTLEELDSLLQQDEMLGNAEARGQALGLLADHIGGRSNSLAVGVKTVLQLVSSAKMAQHPPAVFAESMAEAVHKIHSQ